MELFIFACFIWLAGWMFAVPLCFDNSRGLEGFVVTLIMLIYWPFILGSTMREKLGWRDTPRGK